MGHEARQAHLHHVDVGERDADGRPWRRHQRVGGDARVCVTERHGRGRQRAGLCDSETSTGVNARVCDRTSTGVNARVCVTERDVNRRQCEGLCDRERRQQASTRGSVMERHVNRRQGGRL